MPVGDAWDEHVEDASCRAGLGARCVERDRLEREICGENEDAYNVEWLKRQFALKVTDPILVRKFSCTPCMLCSVLVGCWL